MGSLTSRCSSLIPVAIFNENAPGFRNHVAEGRGTGEGLLRNRSKSHQVKTTGLVYDLTEIDTGLLSRCSRFSPRAEFGTLLRPCGRCRTPKRCETPWAECVRDNF